MGHPGFDGDIPVARPDPAVLMATLLLYYLIANVGVWTYFTFVR